MPNTRLGARLDALGSNPHLVNLVQAERWDGKLPGTHDPGRLAADADLAEVAGGTQVVGGAASAIRDADPLPLFRFAAFAT